MTGSALSRRLPPQRLITLVNPLIRGLLASPLHGAVDRSLLTLHLTGRRTGRHYDIPVGYLDLDGRSFVVTQHRWRSNLRGAARVELTYRGRRRAARATLDENPESVGATLRLLTERAGWRAVRRLTGLTTRDDRPPTLAELEADAHTYDLGLVTLSLDGT